MHHYPVRNDGNGKNHRHWKRRRRMVDGVDKSWVRRLAVLDHAFQPIVNIHTGNTFGAEALVRGVEKAGFSSIDDLFDTAWRDGVLHQVDMVLREKALAKFARFRRQAEVKLFYNLDNRLFDAGDYSPGSTMGILEKYGYAREDLCFELSEKHPFSEKADMSALVAAYRAQGFNIAADDCGTGFSGLQLLYYTEPDYIKIDRFFIRNMDNDPKKRLVVSTIVSFAHLMGSRVLAEGVETLEEYTMCKKIGCDMVQGYFVQHPTRDLAALQKRYNGIRELTRMDRRRGPAKDRSLVSSELKYIEPMASNTDIITLFERFRKEEGTSYIPIVSPQEIPLGVVRDTAFKEYIFSKFGRQLLENPSFGKDISRFITRIPVADIHTSVEKLIEIYTRHNNSEGLIMTDDDKYVGFLSANALLKLTNEKNLTLARNQNPLTRLPGNIMIHEYFSHALSDFVTGYHLIYFDFDRFKPFNDTYGFRNGDRLILRFAELLKAAGMGEDRFVGHVGGDDFFMGVRNGQGAELLAEIRCLARTFKKDAESFYDKDAMEKGYILARDRGGEPARIPLITVSAAVLELPPSPDRECSIETAGNIIARLKKQAKASGDGLAFAGILDCLSPRHRPREAGGNGLFHLHAMGTGGRTLQRVS